MDHNCLREQEIQNIKEEILWLKKNTSTDHDLLVELKTDMKYIKETLPKLQDAIERLATRPSERYDKITLIVIAAIVSAIIGFIAKVI